MTFLVTGEREGERERDVNVKSGKYNKVVVGWGLPTYTSTSLTWCALQIGMPFLNAYLDCSNETTVQSNGILMLKYASCLLLKMVYSWCFRWRGTFRS